MAFIDANKDDKVEGRRLGVEPICNVLQVAPSTYYAVKRQAHQMHTLRHTTAMNLLHVGVDITVIALWLGHEQTSTTDIYLHADMETKKAALEETRPPEITPGTYTPTPEILTCLEAL